MITRKKIIDKAAGVLGVRGDQEEVERLKELLNDIVSSASELHSFHALRRKVEINLANADTEDDNHGTWLPANLAGVDAVQDKSTGIFFTPRDYSELNNVELGRPRYTLYSPGSQPLFYAEDLAITKGSDTFTSIDLDNDSADEAGDYTGEWIQIGADAQMYKLTGARTITPKYWGEPLSDALFQIRPPTQKKLVVHDTHDTQLLTGTVIVYYWIYHPIMHRDNDICLFPNSRWIDLMMLKEARGVLGRRSRDPINVEKDEAWDELVRLNPSFSVPIHNVDRIGNVFDPSTITHVRRGGYADRSYDIESAILQRRN